MAHDEPHGADFVDLLSYDNVKSKSVRHRSNLIKSASILERGAAKIEYMDGEHTEPSIVVHRQDEKVARIEFICSCGKTSTISLEYEDQ